MYDEYDAADDKFTNQFEESAMKTDDYAKTFGPEEAKLFTNEEFKLVQSRQKSFQFFVSQKE